MQSYISDNLPLFFEKPGSKLFFFKRTLVLPESFHLEFGGSHLTGYTSFPIYKERTQTGCLKSITHRERQVLSFR